MTMIHDHDGVRPQDGGKPVGDGKPGPMFARLYQLYQNYKVTIMRGSASIP